MHLGSGSIVILTLVGYFLFSAAVGAMLPPSHEQETRFYGWLYRFLQRLAANADRLASARFGTGLVPAHLSAQDEDLAANAGAGVVRTSVVERIEATSTDFHYQP